MRLPILNQGFFTRLKAGRLFFFKDTLVLIPFKEDYQRVLQLIERDYQKLQTTLPNATYTYQIQPDRDLAQVEIKLRAVTTGQRKVVTKTYAVFLDNVR